jgi:hypothetical protein
MIEAGAATTLSRCRAIADKRCACAPGEIAKYSD